MNKRHNKHSLHFRIKHELYTTVRLYMDIFRKPSLLFLWLFQVLRDIFYELPRSILSRKNYVHLETRLEQSASQALTISEIVTIPGNYFWFFLWKIFTDNVYVASIVGANLGDWISGVLSYAVTYMILTRWHGTAYSPRKALIDNLEVIKDCLPASLVLYVSEAPLIAGLISVWFSADFAIAINLIIAMTLFIWVAKYSADRNIEKRFT